MGRKDKISPCFLNTLILNTLKQRLITKPAGSVFQRKLFPSLQFLRVNVLTAKRDISLPAEVFYVSSVFQAFPCPDAMLYMTHGKAEPATPQRVCKGQRIRTAADCGHILLCNIQFFP